MIDAPFSFYMAGLGLLGGLVCGYFARLSNFCTLGAIEETYYGTQRSRLRTWVLAAGIAIAGTQLLDITHIIDLDKSFYLNPTFRFLGSVLGGIIFGFGMALVGTCAFGMLVRAGSGDMRATVSILLLALVGYTTANGILAYIHVWLITPTEYHFASTQTSSIPDILFGSSDAAQIIFAMLLATLLIGWSISSKRFVTNKRAVAAGIAIGSAIIYGWWVTGTIGQDPFTPQTFESYRFARPMGNTLQYLMTFTGASINFSIGGVLGVPLGALISSLQSKSFHFEAFDDAREMRRHFAGAALMGIGSILALGCTIGQGMSGLATLSINSFLAIGAIAIGAWLGVRYLIEGEIPSIHEVISGMFHREH